MITLSFLRTEKDYSKQTRGKKSRKQLEDKIRQIKARINKDIRRIIELEKIIINQ